MCCVTIKFLYHNFSCHCPNLERHSRTVIVCCRTEDKKNLGVIALLSSPRSLAKLWFYVFLLFIFSHVEREARAFTLSYIPSSFIFCLRQHLAKLSRLGFNMFLLPQTESTRVTDMYSLQLLVSFYYVQQLKVVVFCFILFYFCGAGAWTC